MNYSARNNFLFVLFVLSVYCDVFAVLYLLHCYLVCVIFMLWLYFSYVYIVCTLCVCVCICVADIDVCVMRCRCVGWVQRHHLCIRSDVFRKDSHDGGRSDSHSTDQNILVLLLP